MKAVDAAANWLADHPWRGTIVTTGALGMLVLLLWPAVDVYFALRDYAARLEQQIHSGEQLHQEATELKRDRDRAEIRLDRVSARMIHPDDAEAFRGQVVGWVRETGCQLRQIRLNNAIRRRWSEGDDPLAPPQQKSEGEPTAYDLISQSVSLSASGPPRSLLLLADRLHGEDRFVRTRRFDLRAGGSNRRSANLEIEVTLFALEKHIDETPAG